MCERAGAVPGKDTNIGAKQARDCRSDLAIGPGDPFACLLTVVEEALGLPVIVAALPEGIAGCCWRDGDQVVLWVNGTHAAVRRRFTLAHELGHVRCGHETAVAIDTFATLAGKTTDAREIQANAFAAELLAPAAGVEAMLNGEPTLDDVVLIAARYGISAIAALYRLNTLGLSQRSEALKQEIEEGHHGAVWERLAPRVVDDVLGGLDAESLPRLSPALAGSALAAVADGAASVADAAGAASCDLAQLARGADAIGI